MKKENVNTIGGRIKAAREKAGLSQIQLAEALGYESATAVSLIEADLRKLKPEHLQKVAEALGYDIGYFLGQTPAQVPTIRMALRADGKLTDKDQDAIMHFIELAKKRNEGK